MLKQIYNFHNFLRKHDWIVFTLCIVLFMWGVKLDAKAKMPPVLFKIEKVNIQDSTIVMEPYIAPYAVGSYEGKAPYAKALVECSADESMEFLDCGDFKFYLKRIRFK
jgi:hypothetical protein